VCCEHRQKDTAKLISMSLHTLSCEHRQKDTAKLIHTIARVLILARKRGLHHRSSELRRRVTGLSVSYIWKEHITFIFTGLGSETSVIPTSRQLKKRQYGASKGREAITLWRGFLSQKRKVFGYLSGSFPFREKRLLDSSCLSVTPQVINWAPNTRLFVKFSIGTFY